MKLSESLLGKEVRIRANDFVPQVTSGRIEHADEISKSVLIRLSEPILSQGSNFSHVIASARLQRDDLSTLTTVGSLGCALIWITSERLDYAKPVDVSWWRGGASAIADIVLVG